MYLTFKLIILQHQKEDKLTIYQKVNQSLSFNVCLNFSDMVALDLEGSESILSSS